MSTRIPTQHLRQLIKGDEAYAAFLYLSETVQWIDGIPSRIHGFTRKAAPLTIGDNPIVDRLIHQALVKLGMTEGYGIFGVYLNYYRDGNDFTPTHNHPDSCQVVISLGATRTLKVGSINYPQQNGDVIVFGSSMHGVAKDPLCTEGRISIALFTKKL